MQIMGTGIKTEFADLHNHLYGSIRPELLWEMGKKNPNPRWEIFLRPFEELYGKRIQPSTFFEDYGDPELFRRLYLFNHKGPFPEFQAKFNLIIALSKFDATEIRFIAKQITLAQYQEGVTFGEYRIMYAPNETDENVAAKTTAACEGFAEAESELSGLAQSRLVISLHRDGDFFREYEIIKGLMEKDSLIRKYVVALDFCYIEEGFPPKGKRDFFLQVNNDNKSEPSTALAILYHVGESFQDKSLISAVRWVLQSAEWGAHRLGHAIALGVNPDGYRGENFVETAAERRDTLEFLYERWEEISKFGELPNRNRIGAELDSIRHKERIEIPATETSLSETRAFQNYCMDKIFETDAVIESCPSSNEYIGMVREIGHHPLLRFVETGLKVTISTDDPGIFGTEIRKEYTKAEQMGLPKELLEKIRKNSFSYTSEILSGRQELSK
ncbi:adenosine/AMP deaminase domain protein [Leptospira fainei serovar Hurstbridge str. BUT 6]|uniref:adenosine deaminase n=1 Tax=Leptospira fainei serovar Hurstbridge str. BUT 6 TaxID=1193011 RepID=S3VAM8_9LEPT|nr:adenosine/AMP deaminase domain protein [Leptospira fainei]EPG73495.1 adenosine/AMP deaminase domain protein [Leptospira fainei serovar Hurstbridge str. BUT 6]